MNKIKQTLTLIACAAIVTFSACTNGKGDVVIETLALTGFDKVDISIKGEVVLVTDVNQFVEVHAQQNIIDALKIEVKDGTLKIKEKPGKNIGKYEELTFYVHAPSLREVKTSASGNITGGAGIAASDFKAKTSASGNITMTGLSCQSVEADVSASGNITLGGFTGNAKLETSASGNVKAFELVSNSTEAKTSSSGNIETTTVSTLNVKISGSGDVLYKGDPNISSDDSSSGSVIDAN